MRDQIVEAKLESMGWYVLTVWECELKGGAFVGSMESVAATLLQNREKWLQARAKRRDDLAAARSLKAARIARDGALLAEMGIPASVRRLSEQEVE